MFRGSWAHWAFTFVFALILGALATIAAIAGWWDPPIGTELAVAVRTAIRDLFAGKRPDIEVAIKLLGALVTILTGAFGLLQAWRLGRKRLPKRLEEFLDEARQTSLLQRESHLAEIEGHLPVATGRVRRPVQSRSSAEYLRQLEDDNSAIYKKLTIRHEIASQANEVSRADLATWHLARAVRLERRVPVDGDPVSLQMRALAEGQRALQYDSGELRSYQLCDRLLRALSRDQERLLLLDQFARKAGEKGEHRVQAGALLDLATLLFKAAGKGDLPQIAADKLMRDARDNASRASELFASNPDPKAPTDQDRDAAVAEELIGDIEVERNRLMNARTAYSVALSRFRPLGDPDAVARVSAKLFDLGIDQNPLFHAATAADPILEVTRAHIRLADALIARQDWLGAQSRLYDAQRAAQELPDGEHRNSIIVDISDRLERASNRAGSDAPKPT